MEPRANTGIEYGLLESANEPAERSEVDEKCCKHPD